MGAPLRRLRWRIAVLLFVSTVINYIDRQTISVLAPFLQRDYHWSNTDFATVLIAFRFGYTLMQGAGGRLLDLVGTRLGLTLTVTFYSIVACLTSLASGLTSFRIFRFLLGCGEGPNWPGATKATSEWFPAHDAPGRWPSSIADLRSGAPLRRSLYCFCIAHSASGGPPSWSPGAWDSSGSSSGGGCISA